jgi:hypothetical protein
VLDRRIDVVVFLVESLIPRPPETNRSFPSSLPH